MVEIMKLQTIRRISQSIFFIRYLLVNKFNLSIIRFMYSYLSYLIVIPVVLALIFGRVYCGWMCPFGFLFDLSYKLRVKISKLRKLPKIDDKLHNKLIYIKYFVLVMITILFVIGIKFKMLVLGVFLLVVFMVLSFYIPRFFCRYICPVGALLSLFSKISVVKLRIDFDRCVKCRLCEFKCPMQIKLTENINQMECIRCFECYSVCRKKAIKFK
ncbi:4Fe-4S binding protein [Methanocaldococcus indicus]|uniref:4Fe-4S binding protein n=1 Tax=Methanocaldococcus indicus TaxID=213231 RepID=UPI003C6CD061